MVQPRLSMERDMSQKLNVTLTPRILRDILLSTELAHAEFEKTLGKRDDNWQTWYADYILHTYPELMGVA